MDGYILGASNIHSFSTRQILQVFRFGVHVTGNFHLQETRQSTLLARQPVRILFPATAAAETGQSQRQSAKHSEEREI